MEFLGTLVELMTWGSENWEVLIASVVAVTAGLDKVFLVLFTTMANIKNSWNNTLRKHKDPTQS